MLQQKDKTKQRLGWLGWLAGWLDGLDIQVCFGEKVLLLRLVSLALRRVMDLSMDEDQDAEGKHGAWAG